MTKVILSKNSPLPTKAGFRTHDNFNADRRTIDSTGIFLLNELERLDPKLNMPLYQYTWSRDIDLRSDVTIADEMSSFTVTNMAASGGMNPNGKSWIGKDTTQIAGIALDLSKIPQPLFLWGMELGYSIIELEQSQKVGRPIDAAKLTGIQMKHNMDTDEMVYVGDNTLGKFGLFNSDQVANVSNAVNGNWANGTTTPQQILDDINEMLNSAWEQSGYTYCPTEVRLPPKRFSTLTSTLISSAGNQSVLKFLQENTIGNTINGVPTRILPSKWLTGRGVGGTPFDANTVNRMMAYTKREDLVRYPMVPLQRTPIEYRALFQLTYYYGRLGCVEFPYPQTVVYRDGI